MIKFCKVFILLSFGLLLFVRKSGAQGSLQFNQVIYMSGTSPVTVPAGKVWKIEKVLFPAATYLKSAASSGGSCGCNSGSGYAHTNYVTTPVFESDSNNISINSVEFVFNDGSPLWLPSGTTVNTISVTTPVQASTPSTGCYCPYWIDGVFVGYGPYTPPQVTVNSVISLIEFNVVP